MVASVRDAAVVGLGFGSSGSDRGRGGHWGCPRVGSLGSGVKEEPLEIRHGERTYAHLEFEQEAQWGGRIDGGLRGVELGRRQRGGAAKAARQTRQTSRRLSRQNVKVIAVLEVTHVYSRETHLAEHVLHSMHKPDKPSLEKHLPHQILASDVLNYENSSPAIHFTGGKLHQRLR